MADVLSMSGTRQERLAALLAADGCDPSLQPLVPEPFDETTAPCAFSQRALWAVEQMRAAGPGNHIPLLLRLQGRLDHRALEIALGTLVEQHEILRTTIAPIDGVPVQSIWPADLVELRTSTVSATAEARAAYVDAAREVIEAPFDLELPFPWRAVLLERSPDDHCLALVLHHALFDGTSVGVFAARLAEAYDAAAHGRPAPAPPSLQFAEFAAWQHVLARSGAYDADVQFWVDELAGAPRTLLLGGDRQPSSRPTLNGGVVRCDVDDDTMRRLADIARGSEATMFATGLAAWAAWLADRTGEDSVVVATPIAGRTRPFLSALIGPVVNTVGLHLQVAGEASYGDLVRQVRRKTLAAIAHQHAPVECVLERLGGPRSASATLAPVAFTRRQPYPMPSGGPLRVSRILTDPPGAQTALALDFDGRGERWSLALQYSSDRFSAGAAREALDDFASFLHSIARSPIRPHARRRVRRLTAAQVRVWADQQRSPESPLYNVASTLDIHGELDLAAFAAAHDALVRTTDALRLTFPTRNGEPVQVLTDRPVRLETADLSGEPEERQRAWLAERARVPLALDEPPVRSFLVRRAAGRFTWLLLQHHLITDGWSVRLLCRRLGDLYAVLSRGEAADLETPPQWLDRLPRATIAHAEWWTERFAGIERPAFFGERTAKRSTRVTRTRVAFDADLAGSFRGAVGARGLVAGDARALALGAAALAALLHRYTAQPRVSIGVTIHNRRESDRQTAGLFMDVVPILIECTGSDALSTLMDRAGASLRASLRHGSPPVSLRERTCDVLLNMQTTTLDDFAGHPASLEWVSTGHERESLSLHLHDGGARGVGVDVDTHDEVFDPEQRARIVARVVRVIEQICRCPDITVAALDLMDDEELAAVTSASIGPVRPEACSTTAVERIVRTAAARSTAVAIESGRVRWSYGDLEDAVLTLAGGLVTHGVRRGDVVAVALDRSPDFVASALAVLASGAAYLPLDPAAPYARRAEAVRAARAVASIGPDRFPGCDALAVDDLRRARPLDGPIGVDMHDLAYVIFTSGSTGEPKAVEIPHRALANYSAYAAATFELDERDRVLQFASLAFDTSIEEIFPTLMSGATLVLRDDAAIGTPRSFSSFLDAAAITVLNLPTAYWHQLCAAGCTIPGRVRLTLVGGEAMRADLVQQWRRCAPGSRLLNGYGPTEATVVTTFADLTTGPCADPVGIGAPIWNAEAWVVDGCGRLAPIGTAGELWIAGAGLARGYRDDPEATALRFATHPIDPARRAYRTGDLVRLRRGTLEYLGRLDSQVKISGYRVDLEEIARCLRACPRVQDAVVRSTGLPASLIAYVVVDDADAAPPWAGSIRGRLRASLPEYMVPGVILAVPALPRGTNGKLRHDALDRVATALPEEPARGAVMSVTEHQVAAIWEELLGRQPIAAEQSLFDLGGHSMIAAQFTARARDRFAVDLPLRIVFEKRTVEAVARWIDERRAEQG